MLGRLRGWDHKLRWLRIPVILFGTALPGAALSVLFIMGMQPWMDLCGPHPLCFGVMPVFGFLGFFSWPVLAWYFVRREIRRSWPEVPARKRIWVTSLCAGAPFAYVLFLLVTDPDAPKPSLLFQPERPVVTAPLSADSAKRVPAAAGESQSR
jgi:hypothetical protein